VRHAIEIGGVNAHGIWSFSDWSRLRHRLRGEFARAKQDPVAHTRFVVERRLLADFLDVYDGALADLRVGHPLLVVDPDDEPPDIDFGPLVSACAADRLRERQRRAVAAGAVTLRAGTLDPARFLPGQDVSAYVAPVALLGVPPHCDLHHGAPAGPLDTIVVVDRLWELISQMNASQGSLAASIASDDAPLAAQVAAELRAFAVGINRTRSWDDLNEHRGGLGMSWSGAFAGGAGSVRAVTTARPGAHPPGNHPHGVVMPGDHRRVLGAAGGG
jgi:acyl-CoA reductase-like NAD-dependent aldehyde dehydrogenase